MGAVCLFLLHRHPCILTVARQVDPAVGVGAEEIDIFQGLQRLRRGQAVRVAGGDAEQRDLGLEVRQPLIGVGRGVAALRKQQRRTTR